MQTLSWLLIPFSKGLYSLEIRQAFSYYVVLLQIFLGIHLLYLVSPIRSIST